MIEIRYESTFEQQLEAMRANPSIFLAGPTVRGNQLHLQPSWRFEAVDILKAAGFNGAVIIPEFTDLKESDKGKEWIPRWEYQGLEGCDSILFWVPRTRELIGLTTNWELGYWMGRNYSKITYGRPDGAYRIDYLDNMWSHVKERESADSWLKTEPFNNLKDTCLAAIKYITHGTREL